MATGTPSRREGGIPDALLLAGIGFLLGTTVLLWTGTGLAALVSHGHWPQALHFTATPQAIRQLVTAPRNLAGAWPEVPPADLPRPGLFWGIFLGEVLVLLVLGGFAVGTITRFRTVRAAARRRPAPPPVPAPAAELPDQRVESVASAPAPVPAPAPAPAPAPQDILAPPAPAAPAYESLPEGQLTGTHVLFAGPRSRDKGKRFVQPVVLAAEGPAVVTCATPETYEATAGSRSKLGPVCVFDPEHLIDTPGRLRWAPHSDCAAPQAAASRARALLAPLRTHDITTNDAAATLLRCWLHAAALDNRPFRQLHRWAAGTGSADPVRILRTAHDAAPGWSGELEATLSAHPERRDAAQELIHRALSGLNSLHIRDACSPGRSDGLDLESFMNDRGTLYVVGESREDPRSDPGAMPLLSALVSSVVEHGRRMAARSSPGRLDPPLTCVLDDIANLAPLPELPGLMAEGSAVGIPVLAVLRSEEQARHRWPAREADTIWQGATARLTAD